MIKKFTTVGRLFLLLTVFLGLTSSAFSKDWKALCKEIPKWPESKKIPPFTEYDQLAHTLSVDEGRDRWEEFKKWRRTKGATGKKWIFLDTRGKPDRIVGVIPRSIPLTSDPYDASKHEVTAENIIKKLNLVLDKTYKTIKDTQKDNIYFVVFCNGKNCHRTSYAACSLREMGFSRDDIFLMLEGYPGWVKKGYPTTIESTKKHRK